mmetsp:Transcript_13291/g.45458  ORF Transcript_13291/g.45458 Transcript_13291/m.45458 type:complete len:219 (-) Transcript_13291:2-658(-)
MLRLNETTSATRVASLLSREFSDPVDVSSNQPRSWRSIAENMRTRRRLTTRTPASQNRPPRRPVKAAPSKHAAPRPASWWLARAASPATTALSALDEKCGTATSASAARTRETPAATMMGPSDPTSDASLPQRLTTLGAAASTFALWAVVAGGAAALAARSWVRRAPWRMQGRSGRRMQGRAARPRSERPCAQVSRRKRDDARTTCMVRRQEHAGAIG